MQEMFPLETTRRNQTMKQSFSESLADVKIAWIEFIQALAYELYVYKMLDFINDKLKRS